MVHCGSDLLRLPRDTVRDVPVGLQLIVCQLDVRQLELALHHGHRNGVQKAVAGTAQAQFAMTIAVAIDDSCQRVSPESKAGNGDAVMSGHIAVVPLQLIVCFDALFALRAPPFTGFAAAERDDLLDLSCCYGRTENI